MFPPPAVPVAPTVPADPVTVVTRGGFTKTIVTQDDAGMWYMEGVIPFEHPPCLVNICNACGLGRPSLYPTSAYSDLAVLRFTTGRRITPAQPRTTGTCTDERCKNGCGDGYKNGSKNDRRRD